MNKFMKIMLTLVLVFSIATINLEASSKVTNYSNGNIKSQSYYNGSVKTKQIEYTIDGRMSMMYTFNSNGKVYTKYYYDTNGKQNRSYRYDNNGKKSSAYDYKTVNGKRVIIKKWSYTPSGNKAKYELFYNNGNKKQLIKYNASNQIKEKRYYNTNGHMTKLESFTNGKRSKGQVYTVSDYADQCASIGAPTRKLKSIYTYKNGKLVKRTNYSFKYNQDTKIYISSTDVFMCYTSKSSHESSADTINYASNGVAKSRVVKHYSPYGNEYKRVTTTYKKGKPSSTKTKYLSYQWPVVSAQTIGRSSKDVSYLGDGSRHNGQDFLTSARARINSIGRGKVITNGFDSDGYGWYVEIKQPNGDTVIYAHMDKKSSLKIGQQVKPGQLIGYVGNTGVSYGYHLHLEITSSSGKKYEPLTYLKKKM